jgi:hypothetical protein
MTARKWEAIGNWKRKHQITLWRTPWKRLWTCRKTDCGVNEWMNEWMYRCMNLAQLVFLRCVFISVWNHLFKTFSHHFSLFTFQHCMSSSSSLHFSFKNSQPHLAVPFRSHYDSLYKFLSFCFSILSFSWYLTVFVDHYSKFKLYMYLVNPAPSLCIQMCPNAAVCSSSLSFPLCVFYLSLTATFQQQLRHSY